jgi:adenine-specific DNA-methyltransferase
MTDDLKTVNLEAEKLDLNSLDIAAERQAELLRLFPEVRTEGGKVDFDRLRLALGEVVDVGKERYGMNWPGKADCFKAIQRPSLGTLLPVREESVNFDETENLIIEGDNLEVLKLLQKSYQGKIKMIYIDPPYNTGNDFIYPDNYSENLQTYLEYTGQVDSEGRKFSNNTDSDGRFHSRWMNMMYPRLYLAFSLLKSDGLILVSISDHEVTNLRILMNEIFGEENFSAQFVWKSRKFPDSRAKTGISTDHEYVIAYSRSEQSGLRGIERDESKFGNPDDDPRGLWMSRSILGLASKKQRPNLHYSITDSKSGRTFSPPEDTGWRYASDRMQQLIDSGCILFPTKLDGRPREKKYRNDLQNEFVAFPSIIDDVFTADGTSEIRDIFGEDIFDFAKPSTLIERLVKQGTGEEGDIVLDFFAGSGPTGQGVLSASLNDGVPRKFILVQLPEPTAREDFKTIADITKERVRRVIQRHEKEAEGKLDLGNRPKEGFRVLKLATSNFKIWNAATETTTPDALAKQLELQINHIQQERTSEDLLYEILLKTGFPPTTPIETLTVEGKAVYSVTGYGMLICLERQLTHETIKAIAERKPNHVVCLDEGFAGNDQLKTNAVLMMKSKGVTKFQTI